MVPKLTVDASAYIALSCYLLLMPMGWVSGVLLAMAVHEFGHCAAIWALGGSVYRIHLSAFGAKIETQPMDHRQTLLCALAGPAAGLLLCLFFRWIPMVSICALAQTVFNLIPIGPFDGGRAVKAFVGLRKDKAVAKSADSVYNNSN